MDPSITIALAVAVETAINRALTYDPASQRGVGQLQGVVAIEFTVPSMTFYCWGDGQGVAIASYTEQPVTTHLTGSPLAFLNLLQQPTSLANTGVDLVGSVGLLQQWQQVLQGLDIDWEDALSEYLGDIVGPLAAQGIRLALGWSQQQRREQRRLLGEFITEELQLVPTAVELDGFYSDIRGLSEETDRLTARIAQLSQTLANKEPQS